MHNGYLVARTCKQTYISASSTKKQALPIHNTVLISVLVPKLPMLLGCSHFVARLTISVQNFWALVFLTHVSMQSDSSVPEPMTNQAIASELIGSTDCRGQL